MCFTKRWDFLRFFFCFFLHLALRRPTAQLVWPPPRGTVGTAAERCSWRRGCFLSSPAIGRLLTQHCYYCSHPALPASTAALQMAFAGFFFLPPACLHLENQFSFCCSLRKKHRNVGESFKNETFFVMLQSPAQCFIFTMCTVLALTYRGVTQKFQKLKAQELKILKSGIGLW